ncbi:MAG TPA: aspartyl protease family protein [Rhizomicrobium sp.]|jgi:hypothetical protein
MRTIPFALTLAAAAMSAPAIAAPSVADILSANQAATGGAAWQGKAAVEETYSYAGQGMTGTTHSLTDLTNGHFVDSFAIGPATGAQGFDGTVPWNKDPSGTVTAQDGGDNLMLAVNEAWRRANGFWQSDRAGADIALAGEKSDGGETFDVLTVTPHNGKPFEAWFDANSHLLARIVEKQGAVVNTTTLSDYRKFDSVLLPAHVVIDQGNAKYDQTLTLTGATFVPAPGTAAFAMPKSQVADFTIAHGAHSVSFPFELINNHIYAKVTVNGQGPFTFIFDTGGVNLVTPPLAQKLGLAMQGHMEARGAGAGTMDMNMTKVGTLALGDASIRDQLFMVIPLNDLSKVEGLDEVGMVGFETFHRFVTRIDYGTNTLTLIDPKSFNPKDAGTPVPIVFDGNVPEVKGSYDGIPGKFDIDTGARSELSLTAPFVTKNGLRARYTKGVDAVAGWGVGGPSRGFVVRGGSLKLGDVAIDAPVTTLGTDTKGAFSSDSTAGNIGGGVLRRFVVTLDYAHNVMYLKPIAHRSADIGTYDRVGLWINAAPKGFEIVDVTPNSPASEGGLKAGDTIIAVDGTPATSIALYDLRRRLRDDPTGSLVRFTITRNGTKQDILLIFRDLI